MRHMHLAGLGLIVAIGAIAAAPQQREEVRPASIEQTNLEPQRESAAVVIVDRFDHTLAIDSLSLMQPVAPAFAAVSIALSSQRIIAVEDSIVQSSERFALLTSSIALPYESLHPSRSSSNLRQRPRSLTTVHDTLTRVRLRYALTS